LNRDLAFKNLLTGKLSNGTLSLAWGGEVNESVSNWAVGARVLWDRGRFNGETLEEACQLPLGGRICEVSNVESATLGSAGKNCILSSSLVGRRGLRRLVGNSCLAKSSSNVVDGVSNLLSDGRHDES
jgi:hypothetical protein